MVSAAQRDGERVSGSGDAGEIVYYLLWRTRAMQSWHSEEFDRRLPAHERYLALIERGVEAYLERRRRTILPA
jgi:hypothetical protein